MRLLPIFRVTGTRNGYWLFPILFTLLFCENKANPTAESKVPVIPEPAGWNLVWNDEFDGPKIDPAKWNHETGGHGWGNNESQYYTARDTNAYIEDGNLILRALKENYTGSDGTRDYTSAKLNSRGKGFWTYGRIDIRAKLPWGQGIWPAFWMMPQESIYGGWAASGEIDIMEYLGHETNRVYGTLHYGGSYPENTHTGDNHSLSEGDFVSTYHLFTLEWEEGIMRWFVDGRLYATQTSEQWFTKHPLSAVNKHAPFDQSFYLILNLAVGGNWPGYPDVTTTFPQHVFMDYVRVFEKE